MANVLLTERCVRSCPYCFASKRMKSGSQDDLMSWEDFIYVADLLTAAKERHVALLGGEPTLHPEFIDFVQYMLARGLHVTVFTSGIMTEECRDGLCRHLRNIDPSRLNFTVNLNDPGVSPESESQRAAAFLAAFGPMCGLSFNIYRVDFSVGHLVDAINRHGMRRNIRFGLAHPIPGEENVCIDPGDFPAMAERLASQLPLLERMRVSIGFDCGMPMCLFSSEQIGTLYQLTRGNLHFGCGPAIDIGPDMSVWACFPLSHFHKKSIYEFESFGAIGDYYATLHNRLRVEAAGLYEACDTCRAREQGLCRGGCLAHLLSHFRKEPRVRCAEVYEWATTS